MVTVYILQDLFMIRNNTQVNDTVLMGFDAVNIRE
jgi:hypothetical protein